MQLRKLVNVSYCYSIFKFPTYSIDLLLLQALHHPFTAPNPEDIDDLSSARALAYDMVYNGIEVPLLFRTSY